MFSRPKCQIRNISNVDPVIFYNFDFDQTSGSRSTLICSLIASHPCLTTFESHCQSSFHNHLWFARLPQVLGRPVYFRSHSPWKEFWSPPPRVWQKTILSPFFTLPLNQELKLWSCANYNEKCEMSHSWEVRKIGKHSWQPRDNVWQVNSNKQLLTEY